MATFRGSPHRPDPETVTNSNWTTTIISIRTPNRVFQPDGPHGHSQLVDPSSFVWTDDKWQGIEPQGQVIYEMHIGTFTPEGTWEAARQQLKELAAIGITVVEVMPVNEFSGPLGLGL